MDLSDPTTSSTNLPTLPPLYVELRGGEDSSSGNVFAVNHDGYFGPVCDDYWDSVDAEVVCRQLGYDWGEKTMESYFGEVPWDFAMDEVACNGSEAHLQDCSYRDYDNCRADEGAGAFCYYGSPTTPTTTPSVPTTTNSYPADYVELRGGTDNSSGNVFAVNHNGYFGPVCDDERWSATSALVVCRYIPCSFL